MLLPTNRTVAGSSLTCFLSLCVAEECKNALGMRSKAIPDDAITASSSYDQAQVGPENARSVIFPLF